VVWSVKFKSKRISGLKVSKIAAVAGFDKKWIYETLEVLNKCSMNIAKSQDTGVRESRRKCDFSGWRKETYQMVCWNQLRIWRKIRDSEDTLGTFRKLKPILEIVDQREEVGGSSAWKISGGPFLRRRSNKDRGNLWPNVCRELTISICIQLVTTQGNSAV